MERDAIDRLVDAWCAHDADRAFLPVDRDIVEATRSLRALVCEEMSCRTERDFFHACARLGRMIGERGGSPSLMATTADGLFAALGPGAEIDMYGARVALAEGFAAARLDQARAETLASWEPPACVVRIDPTTIAVAAGFPDDDHDALAAWSAKVAQTVLASGSRNAIVAGRPHAVRAVVDALTLVGVSVTEPDSPKQGSAEKRASWLPWRRNKAK